MQLLKKRPVFFYGIGIGLPITDKTMIRHHLLMMFRNFRHHTSSFLINILGLTAGLSCTLLIYLWVHDELSVDRFHQNNDQLYQVMKNSRLPDGGINTSELTPGPLAAAISEEIPGIANAVGVYLPRQKSGIVSSENRQVRAQEQFAGEDFFQVFSYPLLQGNPNKVLTDKRSILISDDIAKKVFPGIAEVTGRKVEWNNGKYTGAYLVAGVFKKPSSNSTSQFDLLFAFDLFLEKEGHANDWENGDPNTYIVLKKGTDAELINKKLYTYLQSKTHKNYQNLFLRPYADRYLYDHYVNGEQNGGRIAYVNLFSILAFVILLVACVNFMNLSTAKAALRLKEIGVKKVLGANRKTLIAQFLTEAFTHTLIALFISLLVVELLLPQFNQITGKQLSVNYNGSFILTLLAIAAFAGLVSGSYPAVYLSGFLPSAALKGNIKTSAAELLLRSGLVIFQFFVSTVLIIAVLVIYKQVSYIQTKNLGFKKDHLVLFERDGALAKDITGFLNSLKNTPGVLNASNFGRELTNNGTGTQGIAWEGQLPDQKITFKYLFTGNNFVKTLGIEFKEGKDFNWSAGENHSQIIFNEAAVKAMGLKDPLGKTVKQWGDTKQIIGVVKDFHFESLQEQVKPCFFILAPQSEDANQLMVKIQAGREKEIIARIERLYTRYNPGFPFEYRFLDQDFQAQYLAESRIAVLSRYFAILAVMISCLGLFGLATFTVRRRFKEVGIRKVLGASDFSVIYLLSKDFIKPVLMAIAIALPVGYVLSKNWLAAYAHQTELSTWYFLLAGFGAFVISVVTVFFQARKAAGLNPAQSIRQL